MPEILPLAQQGEAILQQVALPVSDFSDPQLPCLVANMLATLQAAKGVGLAAPQVFIPLRIIIVASHPNQRYPNAPHMAPQPMLNPQIIWRSSEQSLGEEGCLSVPQQRAKLWRDYAIRVRYQDLTAQWHEQHYEDFIARIVQHECDHLDGVLFPERYQQQAATPT